jgi:hypothetical protein
LGGGGPPPPTHGWFAPPVGPDADIAIWA